MSINDFFNEYAELLTNPEVFTGISASKSVELDTNKELFSFYK